MQTRPVRLYVVKLELKTAAVPLGTHCGPICGFMYLFSLPVNACIVCLC